jgi:hypothetical protein
MCIGKLAVFIDKCVVWNDIGVVLKQHILQR